MDGIYIIPNRLIVLNSSRHQHLLESLLKHRLPGITLRVSDQELLFGTQEFTFLTSSREMPMMLVSGMHFENY